MNFISGLKTKEQLENNFNSIKKECESVYKKFETRKETAIYFQTQKYPAVLFLMLDKKVPIKQYGN